MSDILERNEVVGGGEDVKFITNKAKVAIIGFGQAGSKLAIAIGHEMRVPGELIIAFNTSEADFRKGCESIPEENRIMLAELLMDKSSLAKELESNKAEAEKWVAKLQIEKPEMTEAELQIEKTQYLQKINSESTMRFNSFSSKSVEGNGMGKDREAAKDVVKQVAPAVVKKVNEIVGDIDLIITCYSVDGGTGSGIGPISTTMLGSLLKKRANVPVIGICAVPSRDTGEQSWKNAQFNLMEQSAYLENNATSTFIVDNDLFTHMKNIPQRYKTINETVARLVNRYIRINWISPESNLDFADRRTMMLTPGCHALAEFNPNTSECTTAFALPEGASVARVAYEIPMSGDEALNNFIQNVGCNIADKSFMGYYEDGVEGATPIVHFAGYNVVSKLIERYNGWLQKSKNTSTKLDKTDSEHQFGYKNASDIHDYMEEKTSVNNDFDMDDILSMSEKYSI